MTLTLRRRPWQAWLVVLIVVLALTFVISAAAMLLWPTDDTLITTTPAVLFEELPIGQGYPVEVPVQFREAPTLPINVPSPAFDYPVYVFLFRAADGDVRAFYRRDPRSGCLVAWVEAEQHFIDPCHGSTYDSAGRYVRGPSQRGLHQFGVVMKDGALQVDVGDFRMGPALDK